MLKLIDLLMPFITFFGMFGLLFFYSEVIRKIKIKKGKLKEETVENNSQPTLYKSMFYGLNIFNLLTVCVLSALTLTVIALLIELLKSF